MHALTRPLVTRESAYGLMAAALVLIAVGAWSVGTAPRVVASQIGINPLQMMANAGDLPSSPYDTASYSDDVGSLTGSLQKPQRRVNKSRRFSIN